MLISLTNRHASVVRATPEERDFLRTYLSFPDPKGHWKNKSPEKSVHRMYNEITATFAAGFLPSVRKAAGLEDIKVDVVDNRVVPVAKDPEANIAWLRDYQREAIDACLLKGRGIVDHPMGSGKSEVQVALTRVFPCSWLMLAPSLSLVNNVADRFLKRNREHGIDLGEPGRIGEGVWTEGEHLTCATYQSIERSLGSDRCRALLNRVGGLMADECHVVPAITFLEATASCDAYFRFGFSGTPLQRGDMKSALSVAALGPVIHKVLPQRLVASKDIAKARGRFTTFRHPMPDGFTYADVYRELVIESGPRNALLVNIAKLSEKPAILFVRNIDHGRALTGMLGRAGVKAQFVWGTHKAPQINQFVKELTRGALDVIVASAVMKQGFDIPSLRSVIFGGSGASVIDTLQKLGRGSRIERDSLGNIIKDEFTVHDVYDVGEQWLEKHSAARKRALLQAGYEVVIEGEKPRAAAARRAAISWRQE